MQSSIWILFQKDSDEYSDQDEDIHGNFKKVRLETLFLVYPGKGFTPY